MMGTDTLKWAIADGRAANNVDDAVRILYEVKDHTAFIYAHSKKKISDLYTGVFSEVKRRNSLIPDINKQMLMSEYSFEAVYKCQHTYVVELDIGPFEEKATLAHPFSEVNYLVLTDPSARKPLSSKALNAFAMIGHMATNWNGGKL